MMATWISAARQSVALRGVSAFSFMKYFVKFLTLARLAVVARLLGPAELGLFGLAILVISITEVFTETGINIVLLKRPKDFGYYYDTAWVVSVIRGALISLLIVLATPLLTDFYQQPALSTFLYVSALIPFTRGWLNPALVLFQQRLQFTRESLVRIAVQVVDLTAGLVFAIWLQSGLGLILGVMCGVFFELMLSYTLFTERPNPLRAKWQVVKKLYRESKFIIGNGMVHYLTENIDDVLIGRVLGVEVLGFYQTAYKVASALTMDFASIIGQITYPLYARLHEKKKSVMPLWQQATLGFAFVSVFLAVPLFVFTTPLIRLIFGADWLPIVPAVRILFVAGAMKGFLTLWNPLSILADNLYHHLIINGIILVTLTAGIVTFAPRWGLSGASLAILVSFALVHPYGWFALKQALGRLQRHAQ